MIAIDFFCGAGGLTRGLLDSGIPVLLGIDNDDCCRETYEKNNPPARFLATDIRKLTVEQLQKHIPEIDPKELLFAACAPCQPFTKLKPHRSHNENSTLLMEFGRLIAFYQPHQILMENVPGIARVRGLSTFRRFVRLLTHLGYEYQYETVDAKEYGVPQTRRRLLLIAMKGQKPILPPRTHGLNLKPYENVGSAIRHYPAIVAGEKHVALPNHQAASLSETNLKRMRSTPHNGGNRESWPKDLWLECHKNGHKGHTDVYGRMRWDCPAPALTCKCFILSNGRYGHPEQDRAISLREAARLQSFPDDYVFHGKSMIRLGMQIGNAVPVRLAEAAGRQILALRSQPL